MSPCNKKITAPNFTQTPNIIYDYWMAVLTNPEFKVLMCVCRFTFGWHRDCDNISRAEICKMTGLCREAVRKALMSLLEHKLIEKKENISRYGDNEANTYRVIVTDDEPKIMVEVGHGVAHPDPGVAHGWAMPQPTPLKPTYISLKKEEKEITPIAPSPAKVLFCENVLLTPDEHEKLLKIHGNDKLKSMIEILDDYIASSGKKYKSHYHVLKPSGWVHTRYMEQRTPGSTNKFTKDRRTVDINGNPVENPLKGRF